MKKKHGLKPHKLKPAKFPHEKQLHFGHYWEHLANRRQHKINIKRKQQKDFQLKLKKRRPLWKEMAIFMVTTISVWGVSHVALNYSAFAEITNFKLQTSITNLKNALAPQPKPVEKLKKVKGRYIKEYKYEGENSAKKMFGEMLVYPADNRVILPRIGKNVPLISVPDNKNWRQLEKTIQKGLQNGVVVHPISREPGNMGNFFLTGHSSYYAWDKGRYKDVFALLHEIKAGDEAIVYWKGKKYTYVLSKSKIVPPTEVSVLKQPNDRSMITLMTCTPVGTNKNRLIWTGDLVSVE